jgi:hypothetical protein
MSTPTHTENGDAFEPVTEDLHAYGEDPDARVPESAAELSEELGRLAGELHDASLILRRVSSHFDERELEEELGTIMTAERIADRCHTRLQEAADALSNGHTEHVGWRMDEVRIPVGNAHSLLSDWMGGYPSATAENLAGTIFTPVWTLDYVEKRLAFLVNDCELGFLD